MKFRLLAIFIILFAAADLVSAQTTEFTYQGSLKDGASAANGNYDFEFLLFDALAGGTQLGVTLTRSTVAVSSGVFSVKLDFGGQFPGAARFMEIRVRQGGGGGGGHTILAPRQQIGSSPYAVQSLNSANAATAATASNSLQLGGVAANQYVITTDPRMTDARNPLPGSSNYIQNTVGVQASSNFNISGTGTANILNAGAHFSIAGNRVLSIAGTENVFAGYRAGLANTTGTSNAFFGTDSGKDNVTGSNNAFFGLAAGANSTGDFNSFFGSQAGLITTSGVGNSFFGYSTGRSNTTGTNNSFFGRSAGQNNTAGDNNSFFGFSAGFSNTTGGSNAFFGFQAGGNNVTGIGNAFFGTNAGASNTTGTLNTIIGATADVGSNNLTAATAIGYGAIVGTSNSVVLGRAADTVRIPGVLNVTGTITSNGLTLTGGLNVTGSIEAEQYNIKGTRVLIATGPALFPSNTFVGVNSGSGTAINTFHNSFFGRSSGDTNTTGGNNTILGADADVGSGNLNFATAIGSEAVVSQSNTVVLGRSADIVRVPGSFASVGGLTTNGNLTVLGTSNLIGPVDVATLGAAGSTDVCRNVSNQLSTCSSSLRYKTNVNRFSGGLDLVRRLRPITFSWKDGGMHDVGFAAEEVEKIEPLLTTYNDQGDIEGVKYAQITTVLVNAVKEQQAQIETQRSEIHSLKKTIEGLQKIVCRQNRQDEVCSEGN